MVSPLFTNPSDEVLYAIFSQLPKHQVSECQRVCRSWCKPARNFLYRKVILRNDESVECFVRTMNENPSHANLVKQLEIGRKGKPDFINCVPAMRLFATPMNVKELILYNTKMLNSFVRDSAIRELLENFCKNLEMFTTPRLNEGSDYAFVSGVLRERITSLRFLKAFTFKDLTGFPQLQELDLAENQIFRNFQGWLPIFEQPVKLTTLHGCLTANDEEEFVETYLKTISRTGQHFVLERLAQIEQLQLTDQCFSPASIQFIVDYFIGLQNLDYKEAIKTEPREWNDTQKCAMTDFLNVIDRLQTCTILFRTMHPQNFDICIPVLLEKVFQPKKLECSGILKVSFNENHKSIKVAINSKKLSKDTVQRTLEIEHGRNHSPISICDALPNAKGLKTIHFGPRAFCPKHYLTVVQKCLDNSPTTTKVYFDLPDAISKKTKLQNYNQITSVVISSRFDFTCQETFEKGVGMFPNVKDLELQYFCGAWKLRNRTFRLPLEDYELETLSLDVTPVLLKVMVLLSIDKKNMANPPAPEKKKAKTPVSKKKNVNPPVPKEKKTEPHFLFHIQVRKRLFVYWVFPKTMKIIKLDPAHVTSLSRKDSVNVRLEVKTLKKINLCAFKEIAFKNKGSNYLTISQRDIVKNSITFD